MYLTIYPRLTTPTGPAISSPRRRVSACRRPVVQHAKAQGGQHLLSATASTSCLLYDRNWAKEAGFRRSELIEVPGPSPVMLFQK